MIRIGAQLSTAPGLESMLAEAKAAGYGTAQVFSRSPVGGQAKPMAPRKVHRAMLQEAGIRPLYVHAPYYVNPAATNPEMQARAQRVLREEMQRVRRLGGDYLVLHPGHRQAGSQESSIQALVTTVQAMLERPGMVLIENAAGQGKELGSEFGTIRSILDGIGRPRRTGVLLDTAHAMAAGYPMHTLLDVEAILCKIDEAVGLQRVAGVHLNDSWYPVGSHRDRHAHLLEGQFGAEGLRHFLAIAQRYQWPLILETPGHDVLARQADVATIHHLLGLDDHLKPSGPL